MLNFMATGAFFSQNQVADISIAYPGKSGNPHPGKQNGCNNPANTNIIMKLRLLSHLTRSESPGYTSQENGIYGFEEVSI
jgi:hypothetical protein